MVTGGTRREWKGGVTGQVPCSPWKWAYQLVPGSAWLQGRWVTQGWRCDSSSSEYLFSHFKWAQRCSVRGRIEASKAQVILFWKEKGPLSWILIALSAVTNTSCRYSFSSRNETGFSYSFQEPCEGAQRYSPDVWLSQSIYIQHQQADTSGIKCVYSRPELSLHLLI